MDQLDVAGDPPTRWCPGGQPSDPDAVIFGVRTGVDGVRVGYLDRTVKATDDVLALSNPVDPLEVFRVGVPCAGAGCAHFGDGRCGLASAIVADVPVAVEIAPACALRSACRWFSQEGTAACLRCPAVITRETGRNGPVALAASAAPRLREELVEQC